MIVFIFLFLSSLCKFFPDKNRKYRWETTVINEKHKGKIKVSDSMRPGGSLIKHTGSVANIVAITIFVNVFCKSKCAYH